MKPRKQAERPLFTVKELREYIHARPELDEALEVLNEMKAWFFANLHLITLGEEVAFKKYINELYHYTQKGNEWIKTSLEK